MHCIHTYEFKFILYIILCKNLCITRVQQAWIQGLFSPPDSDGFWPDLNPLIAPKGP